MNWCLTEYYHISEDSNDDSQNTYSQQSSMQQKLKNRTLSQKQFKFGSRQSKKISLKQVKMERKKRQILKQQKNLVIVNAEYKNNPAQLISTPYIIYNGMHEIHNQHVQPYRKQKSNPIIFNRYPTVAYPSRSISKPVVKFCYKNPQKLTVRSIQTQNFNKPIQQNLNIELQFQKQSLHSHANKTTAPSQIIHSNVFDNWKTSEGINPQAHSSSCSELYHIKNQGSSSVNDSKLQQNSFIFNDGQQVSLHTPQLESNDQITEVGHKKSCILRKVSSQKHPQFNRTMKINKSCNLQIPLVMFKHQKHPTLEDLQCKKTRSVPDSSQESDQFSEVLQSHRQLISNRCSDSYLEEIEGQQKSENQHQITNNVLVLKKQGYSRQSHL